MIITHKDFMKLTGLTSQGVSMALKRGKIIKENNNFDLDNPINKTYLRDRNIFPEDILSGQVKPQVEKMPEIIIEDKPQEEKQVKNIITVKPQVDESGFEKLTGLPKEMMDLTLKDLVQRFGGSSSLEKYVNILSKLFKAYADDTKIQAMKLDLIERNFVISHVFRYLESLSEKLFQYPKRMIYRIVAKVESNEENYQIALEEEIKSDLSQFIVETKKQIENELIKLKHKYDRKEVENENSNNSR